MTQVRTEHALPASLTGASDGTITTLIAAVQLGIVLAGVTVVNVNQPDVYDRPGGPAVGVLFLLVLILPVMAALGALHTVAVTMPADLGASAAARRLPAAPEWLLRGVLLAVLGALYAIPASLMGSSYVAAWATIAASGVLPLLGVTYFRRREGQGRPIGLGGVWARILVIGFVVLVATMVACDAAVS